MSEHQYFGRTYRDSERFNTPYLCKIPFTGFYIGPQGHIVLCCMAQGLHLGHINDIDDLEEFYNSPVMEKYRKQLEDKKYETMNPCNLCYKRECVQKLWPFKKSIGAQYFDNFDSDWFARKEGKKVPLRYLEYTLSNICNADCATCRSEWSSKWEKLDRKFGRKVSPMVKIEDKNIAKIEKILYGLEHMTIKGGEPFADIRNIRVLKKLSEVNPKCYTTIISNFHVITPEAMNIIKKLGKINCCASVDAVTNETYKWIRGGDLTKTTDNMKRYFQETGKRVTVNVFTSLYNFFLLDKIKDYFEDKDYIRTVNFNNYAINPIYISPSLLPEYIFNKQMEKLETAFLHKNKAGGLNVIGTGWEDLGLPEENRKEMFFKEMDKMNKHRGFDLCDYIPELKDWKNGTL